MLPSDGRASFGRRSSGATNVLVFGLTLVLTAGTVSGTLAPGSHFQRSVIETLLLPTPHLVANIPVGGIPYGLAYDSGKGEIFVAVSNTSINQPHHGNHAGNVSVINDTSNTVVAKVRVGVGPVQLAYDSARGEVFATNFYSGTVSVISDATNSVIATIPLEPYLSGIVFDRGTSEMYVATPPWNVTPSNVSVISDVSDTVVASIQLYTLNSLVVGVGPTGGAYDSGTGQVFVPNEFSRNVSVISDSTNTVTSSASVSYGLAQSAYDPAQSEVLVTSWALHGLAVISDLSDTVTATIPVGNSPEGVAYDDGAREFFVANSYYNVTVISALNNSPITTILVGDGPWGVVSDAGTGEVFVTNSLAGNVSVISDGTHAATGASNPSWPSLFGLPGFEGYALLGALMATILGAGFAVARRFRGRPSVTK
ncbi:MAG: YncE family protein [Thermoplasmata archaeon]